MLSVFKGVALSEQLRKTTAPCEPCREKYPLSQLQSLPFLPGGSKKQDTESPVLKCQVLSLFRSIDLMFIDQGSTQLQCRSSFVVL